MSAHDKRPAAALLFSCNGRGSRLFDRPDHDAGAVRAEAGAIPLAGFFAQGELGPVGGQNFLHGFTASVGACSRSDVVGFLYKHELSWRAGSVSDKEVGNSGR